jgi:hypothetical protein
MTLAKDGKAGLPLGRKKQGIPLPECPVVKVSYCILTKP